MADDHARATADRVGVVVRDLESVAQARQACRMLDEIWGLPPDLPSEVQPALLLALAHSGNYVRAAFRGTEMVGASVGFFAAGERDLHSHITGVLPGSSGVGTALKWDQRAWALEHGRSAITWTFDPLIARNAFFNIARLGARPVEYLVDFYGLLEDGRNSGQPTDRVLVRWELAGAVPVRTAPAQLPPGTVVLRADDAGRPLPAEPSEPLALVQIPSDIEGLRLSDPQLALDWRLALRAALQQLFAAGAEVVDFHRDGWYVLRGATATG